MAAPILHAYQMRRALRRNRVFRDRTNPLDVFNDNQFLRKFRFPRAFIYQLTGELEDNIKHPAARKGSLPPVLQVCLALRFYATGATQGVIGDLFGVDQSTASRTITRVTNALYGQCGDHITMPTQAEATQQTIKFYQQCGFPGIFQFVLFILYTDPLFSQRMRTLKPF